MIFTPPGIHESHSNDAIQEGSQGAEEAGQKPPESEGFDRTLVVRGTPSCEEPGSRAYRQLVRLAGLSFGAGLVANLQEIFG